MIYFICFLEPKSYFTRIVVNIELNRVNTKSNRAAELERLLRERIVILDGAMGTMIQQRKLMEADFRGERFKDWKGKDLKGNNDLLNITKPEVIEDIHRQYLEAGADIIEANTFNSQAVSLADYGLESLAYELSRAGAECARRTADRAEQTQPGRVCFVAGAIGPTTKTSSISTDVNNPAARGCTYDELVTAYSEQVRGLLDGGVDLLLVETIFDTLNAKAAFFAIQQIFEERGIEPLPYRRDELRESPSFQSGARVTRPSESLRRRVPILASVTFIQAGSNRGVTGQTVEAFWNSISHVPLLSVGMNCALGPRELRPLIEELSGIAPVYVSAYPNAGLPNPLLPTGFPETPETLAPQLREWAQNGWLNIVGGCCGTTPAHIKAIAEAVRGIPPRKVPAVEPYLRLSGLDALTIRGKIPARMAHSASPRPSPLGRGRIIVSRSANRATLEFPRDVLRYPLSPGGARVRAPTTTNQTQPLSISSTSASARTSPVRRNSRSSSRQAITRPRSPSRASRSRTARTSSTSAWTKG